MILITSHLFTTQVQEMNYYLLCVVKSPYYIFIFEGEGGLEHWYFLLGSSTFIFFENHKRIPFRNCGGFGDCEKLKKQCDNYAYACDDAW